MCTVSFLPKGKEDFILTSNRDEGINRKSAENPSFHPWKSDTLLFPKDGEAGGTWIGIAEKKRMACLLNGAFSWHKHQPPYRHSRGLVVKDSLVDPSIHHFLYHYPLNEIEPFTLLLVDWSSDFQFWELVWDGQTKHIRLLPRKPLIWSSSTLYTDEMKALRVEWFSQWIQENPSFEKEKITHFHLNAGVGDPITNLITERGFLRTVSNTCVVKRSDVLTIDYQDLVKKTSSEMEWNLAIISKSQKC